MSTESKIVKSLEAMFLSKSNTRDLTAYLGRNALKEMKAWAAKKSLDDYESVSMDFSETLDFANTEFVKDHKQKGYELNMAEGQKHPKFYIDEGVERYNVDDFRTHDAQSTQEVFRSNANFRYGNKIKQWRIKQHSHHYDRDAHEAGLRDTRELNTLQRGYNMSSIYKGSAGNPYVSSDSIAYANP
jgi:hypothetical protein